MTRRCSRWLLSARTRQVATALRLAVRAPSVHNCQPWRWLVGPGTVHLYADGSRQVPATDPHGRDLLISCGAALNHLLVALASLGWDARVRRMPNPARPGHLATVEPFPHTATSAQHDSPQRSRAVAPTAADSAHGRYPPS